MRRNLSSILAVLALVSFAGSAAAHHGTSITYEMDKTITVSGTVVEFDFGYPHPSLTDPQYYTKPFESDRKVFKLNALQFEKPWDEQIYCVPSEEQKFNRLIRDPASGK